MDADTSAARSRRAHTAVVAAGRTNGAGQLLNVPLVLASNFRAMSGASEATPGREYSRHDGTPTWEALEQVIGELEGGRAVAFSSGMAAAASVFDLLPAGSRVVAPTDGYSGVQALLADGQEEGRWSVELVDVTDTDGVLAAAAGADLLWLESPTNPLLEIADPPALAARAGTGGRWSRWTTPSPPRCCSSRCSSAPTSSCTARRSSSGATPTSCSASPSPTSCWPGGCAAVGRWPARRPERWRRSWRCAACAPWPSASTTVSAAPVSSPAAWPTTPLCTGCATPACLPTPDMPARPRR